MQDERVENLGAMELKKESESRGDHGPGRAATKKICPLTGPGLISGRIFVSKAR